jgi:hypothetical protein
VKIDGVEIERPMDEDREEYIALRKEAEENCKTVTIGEAQEFLGKLQATYFLHAMFRADPQLFLRELAIATWIDKQRR